MKAFNTRSNDQFGWALAMSRDGNTIAVGSHLEDSGAKGINGDQSDASAEDSGAVYVYTRSGDTWIPGPYVKASNPKPQRSSAFPWHLARTARCSPWEPIRKMVVRLA